MYEDSEPVTRLADWMSRHGRSSARIVASDSPDLGMEVDALDLGNGYHVCTDTEDYGDYVHAFNSDHETNYPDIPKGFTNQSAYWTGQYGSPDCMHNSEYVGGGLARTIVETPGLWRFPLIIWDCEEDCYECEVLGCLADDCQCDGLEGWLVLFANHPED